MEILTSLEILFLYQHIHKNTDIVLTKTANTTFTVQKITSFKENNHKGQKKVVTIIIVEIIWKLADTGFCYGEQKNIAIY